MPAVYRVEDLPRSKDVVALETSDDKLVEGRPLLVTSESHSDYCVSGMYMVVKTMSAEDFKSIMESEFKAKKDPKWDAYSNVSTPEFLAYAIREGYIIGPIGFRELNDAFELTLY